MRNFFLGMVIASLLGLLGGCQFFSGGMSGYLPHSDAALTQSINLAFSNNAQLSGVPIGVEAHKGHVLLSGYVKTIRQSDVAADVASRVEGVKFVQNNLVVRK